MNLDDFNAFLDSLTDSENPDVLKNIIASKNLVGELNDTINDLKSIIENIETSLKVKDELIFKYEKLIKEYIKETPVSTSNTNEVVSNYDDFMND